MTMIRTAALFGALAGFAPLAANATPSAQLIQEINATYHTSFAVPHKPGASTAENQAAAKAAPAYGNFNQGQAQAEDGAAG